MAKDKNEKFCIYGLIDPRDQRLRYVGMTKDTAARYSAHLNSPKHESLDRPVVGWIAELKVLKAVPHMVILVSDISDIFRAGNWETIWIECLQTWGAGLLNVRDKPGMEW